MLLRTFILSILAGLYALLLPLTSHGQTTVVYGKVTDASTEEPIPFVKVYFLNTKISAVTDIDGNYRLESYYASDTLAAHSVGYKMFKQEIEKDEEQEVNIRLEPRVEEISEFVVVAPKRDPAIEIWKRVQRNKDANNREKLDAYEYEVYNKVEFDVNNFSEKLQKRKVFKHFDFIFENIDSINGKRYLPLFMTESISRYFYRNSPKSEKEFINATKVSGVKNKSISQFLGDMYQNVNIYDNNVVVFGKSFISPLSGSARLYYKFYLMDSTWIDNHYCYQIRFLPRREHEPLFIGDMWVNDTTYAIKKVQARITETANINFVNELEVEQTYDEVEDEVWMITKDKLFVDFYYIESTMGVFARKTTSYTDFVINQPREDDFYSGGQNIFVDPEASEKSDEYWEEARHDTLSASEDLIYNMMDTLEQIPQVQTYIDVIQTILTGYKIWGPVEIGPYTHLVSYNPVEGLRLKFGGRTSNDFSTRVMLSGYGAYGFLDQEWKYGAGVMWMVSKQPRQVVSVEYKRDMEQLGQGLNAFKQSNFVSSVFRRRPNFNLTMIEEYKASYDREWFPGFNTILMYRNRHMSPRGRLDYLTEEPTGEVTSLPGITASEFTLYNRFAYDEKFLEGEFDRISLGTRYPVIDAQYVLGIKDFIGGDYGYHKGIVSVKHWFPLGIAGWMKYRFEAGKVWGNLPYPLLELHPGNESYYMDYQAFNLMNFFEFISDEYVTGIVEHHFDGLFLNKIPLLRKLQWREVVTAKAAIGRFRPSNTNQMLLLPGMNTLDEPYYEAAVGIENIFKVLRVDAIWRLSHLDHEDIIKFGVRFQLDVQF